MSGSAYFKRLRADQSPLWKGKGPLLTRLDIELTERCSNNCIHCYINLPTDDSEAKRKELAADDIKAILEEAVSLGCLTVRFTGGEPLLREDFEDIYVFSRRLGLKVLLLTNAALITPNLAELFSRLPPLKKIEVSLYGMRKESYEAVTRTAGSFEAAVKGINLLLEKKIPFIVKGAVLPPNRAEVKELDRWASALPWMDMPPSYSIFFDLRGRRDSDERNRIIKKMRLSWSESCSILSRDREGYFKEMKEFCSRSIGPPGDKIFSCEAGIGGGCVDAYGNLQLCMTLRHPETVYNLKTGSLKDALMRFFPELRGLKARNPDYLSRCARCFLNGLCEQCPAKSWMEHGTLDRPVEYFCGIAHAQANELGLLKEGEKAWDVKDWIERRESFVKGGLYG